MKTNTGVCPFKPEGLASPAFKILTESQLNALLVDLTGSIVDKSITDEQAKPKPKPAPKSKAKALINIKY